MPGQHAIAVYDSPAEQVNVLAAYVREGLARGERVLCFSHRDSAQNVAASLVRRGIDVDRAASGGQLVLASSGATYLRSGSFEAAATKAAWFDEIAQTIASGYNVMRVAADMNWAAEAVPGAGDLAAYEASLGDVFATGHVIGLCEFDRSAFAPGFIEELAHLHSAQVHSHHLLQGAGFDVSLKAQGVAVAGEVDFYNRDEFENALDAALAALRALDEDIYVDLSGLRFIDAGGMSALIRCTRRLRPGTVMILGGMRPHIRRSFEILRFDRVAQLRLKP